MNDFLKQMLQSKQTEINLLKQQLLTVPKHVMQKLNDKVRDKNAALLASELAKSSLTVIGEIKRYSPSKGLLAMIENPNDLARQYVLGGAKSISVLTESHYFHGSPADLQNIKKAISPSIPGAIESVGF